MYLSKASTYIYTKMDNKNISFVNYTLLFVISTYMKRLYHIQLNIIIITIEFKHYYSIDVVWLVVLCLFCCVGTYFSIEPLDLHLLLFVNEN